MDDLSSLTEAFRNGALVLFGIFGVVFASAQLRRARQRDRQDVFVKAVELLASQDFTTSKAGFMMLVTLRRDPRLEPLIVEVLSDYIGADAGIYGDVETVFELVDKDMWYSALEGAYAAKHENERRDQ